ncbi:MAG: hypothetical protein ACRD9R_01205 [Pyrinomonadaceae bacterium]
MRGLALRFTVALLTFAIGTLITALGGVLSWHLVVSLGSPLVSLLTMTLGAFWCLLLAFAPNKSKGDTTFTLLMLCCGLVILVAGVGMFAGVIMDALFVE